MRVAVASLVRIALFPAFAVGFMAAWASEAFKSGQDRVRDTAEWFD